VPLIDEVVWTWPPRCFVLSNKRETGAKDSRWFLKGPWLACNPSLPRFQETPFGQHPAIATTDGLLFYKLCIQVSDIAVIYPISSDAPF
jgi:hypothetical protein